MKKTPEKKVQKAVSKISKKATRTVKRAANVAKRKTGKVKAKSKTLLDNTKETLNDIKKKSSKTLDYAKDKVVATEEEILEYVKQNPVKSISAVALAGLIAGFISRLKK